jgi:hypothetical protein
MYKIIIALLTFLISLSVIARVGENRNECIKRYGPGEDIGAVLFNPNFSIPVTYSFHNRNNIVVTVWYVDGKCICIQYLRMPRREQKDIEWKKAEIDLLLKINGEKNDWEKIADASWLSTDRRFAGLKQDMNFSEKFFGASAKKEPPLASCLTVLYSKYVDKMRSKATMKAQSALSEF